MEKSFTTAIKLYIIGKSSGCGSVWLERTAGGREVAGSNPVAPIFIRAEAEKASALFVFLLYSSFSTPFIPRITSIVITISAIAIGSAIQADWTKPAMM